MPTLYYAPGACSLSVHIVLEWIGAPYEAVRVNPSDPQYATINPAGAVPAFDYGGASPLTQCAAVHHYLALTHPEADLLDERSPESSAELERWSAFITGDLHPAFFPVFMPGRYTISTDEDALAQVKTAGLALVAKRLALLDSHLEGRTWMTGDKRTYLDAYVTPMLRWASGMTPAGLGPYPDVAAHHERMLADDGVRRAMAAEGLIAAA
jgi:glutathione S-transferase